MNKRTIILEIETIRSGQPRRYADSYYEYKITASGISEYDVKSYCCSILKPCRQSFEEWQSSKESPSAYFAGYYTFEKIGENQYKYFVMRPFCD